MAVPPLIAKSALLAFVIDDPAPAVKLPPTFVSATPLTALFVLVSAVSCTAAVRFDRSTAAPAPATITLPLPVVMPVPVTAPSAPVPPMLTAVLRSEYTPRIVKFRSPATLKNTRPFVPTLFPDAPICVFPPLTVCSVPPGVASNVRLLSRMPAFVSPVTTLSSNAVMIVVPLPPKTSIPALVAVTVLSWTESVAVPLDPWVMSMPSSAGPDPETVLSPISTSRSAALADVTSIAFAPVLPRSRPRISMPVRSPFAVLASTVTAFADVVTIRGRVPGVTSVPNGATVNPTPSPISF